MSPATVPPARDIVLRVKNEFLDLPGLRLTEQQARRLWNLDPLSCSAVLSALIDVGFLIRARDGSFMRIDQAPLVKVELTPGAVNRARIQVA